MADLFLTGVRTGTTAGLRRVVRVPTLQAIPPGRLVDLPGRGRTYVTDVPGPSPDAPTLMLLHALTTTAMLCWYPVVEALSEHYRVVMFDQRWHGRGIRSERFRLDDCADDVAAVLDEIGVEQAVMVGYSMGGAIAQLAWRQHPSRVSGLVLGATTRNFRCARREKVFFPLLSAAMTPLGGYTKQRVDRYAETIAELPSWDGGDPHWGGREFRSTSAWALPEVLAEIGRFNSAPWVAQIDVPTSVLVTAKDRTVPTRRQLRLAAEIPGAEVFTVDGGHGSVVLGADVFRPALVAAANSVVRRTEVPRLPRARRSSRG